jgi:hypothetical protein
MTSTQVKAVAAMLHKILPDLRPLKVEYEDALSDTDAIRASYHYKHASNSGEAER